MKFVEFIAGFNTHYVLKFGRLHSRGHGVMGVLSWGIGFPPNFQRPIAVKLYGGPPNVYEVKNVPEVLYHHAKFGGARISRAARATKNVEFFLFVCPSRW